ncbi:MAG TPA: hypothetical protein VN442_25945 [Bryobacteraceae bacterium]|nr:hypothetical protein [Bryobacteraceae bacterium]
MRGGQHAIGLCLLVYTAAFAQQKPPTELERAVEEFRVQTRTLGIRPDSPPKVARSRSTLKDWHGRLYENFRNDALDAVPHEIRQRGSDKSLLRRNQFGFNLGGPLALPHVPPRSTFFSLSYEGVRERISRTYLRTIPTVPERTGDFSAVVDQSGVLLPIYDPASTRENPLYDPSQSISATNLQYERDLFPGNRIPTARLDGVAQKAIPYYPEPNTDVGPFFRNNYFINAPETNVANGMIGKLDQTIRERHRVTLDLAFSNGFLGSAQWFPTAANPGATDRRFSARRGGIEHVFTATSRTVNTASFEASSETSNSGEATESTDFSALLGLAGIGGQSFPVLNFSPYLSMGRAYPQSRSARNTFVWSDALSTQHGKHNMRFSATYRRYQVNTYWPQYPAGSISFSSGVTSLPGIVNTGHAFASFLLGLSRYAEQSVVLSPSYFRRSQLSVAARDRYELRKGLVVSAGLALERNGPRTEKYDRQSSVHLGVINPANGLPGALVAAGRDGRGHALQPTLTRLEPNASVAWNPRGDPKSVVRASFSRSYSALPIYTAQWGTQGFAAYPTYISPNVQLEPAVLLSRGLPPLLTPLPNLAADAANNTVADLMDMSDRLPTYQSASLSVERQVSASVVVTVGASYSGGKNLLVGNSAANPNAIPLDALQFRDLLNDEEFNRSLRPYPQYKGFDIYSAWPIGRYQRNAAYVRVEKRASKGFSLNVYYEYAKQMDDYSGPYGKQDFFNRQNEWSRTAYSPPQYMQFSYVYELPMGGNRPFLRYEDWRKHMVDGWSITGMASISSGSPIYLHPQFNNTGGVVQALNVNAVPGVDARVPNRGPDLWFNPAAFEQPADFSIGNVSRTLPNVLNPGYQNYDISLNKRIPLAPDRTLEFSAAGFNFVNHANWNEPDNIIGPASAPNVNAGKIIGSRGGRVVQLGLRLSF